MSMDKSTRFGALAVLLAAVFALPQAAAGQSGGQPTPDSQPDAGPVDPSFQLSARRSLLVGGTLRIRGEVPGAGGRTVSIERRDAAGLWSAVGAAQARKNGSFSSAWRPDGPGRFALRAVLASGGSARANKARSSAPRTVTVYRPARATWYGPGFYGRRTACGQRLGRSTLGVAHRRLPCGTLVAISFNRRSIVVPVIDRGPFANGATWDLTGAAARRLGVTATSRIGALPLPATP